MHWVIDVGNTHTSVGAIDGSTLLKVCEFSTSELVQPCEAFVGALAPLLAFGSPSHVGGVAVVAGVKATIDETFSVAGLPIPIWLTAKNCGIKIDYETPETLGADRIANVIGASIGRKLPLIVFDLGTATTLDAMDRLGSFSGGAILPGLGVSLQALLQAAPALPEIDIEMPSYLPARSTVEALQAGAVSGHFEACCGLARKMEQTLDASSWVSTGAFGELFAASCGRDCEFVPELTLVGAGRWLQRKASGELEPRT